jgi:hypothetical protein
MNGGNKLRAVSESTWYSTYVSYFSEAILYTRKDGTEYAYTISIGSSNDESDTMNYPMILLGQHNINIELTAYQKQPNEIFALNYEMMFLPADKDNDFVGSEFINNNLFVTDKVRNLSEIRVYLNKASSEDNKNLYSILDTKVHDDSTAMEVSQVNTSVVNGFMTITFVLKGSYSFTRYGFAIGDLDGNILFATNRTILTGTHSVQLCLQTHWKRQDSKVLSDLT